MTFEQFYRAVLKRWYIVLAFAVCVCLGTYVGSSVLLKPVYSSTAVVQAIVRNGGDPLTSDNILASQNLAATEADLATTYPVLNAVAAHYPGLTAGDLSGEVTATAKAASPLVSITVQDRDPTQAASIANDIANTLIQQQLQAIQRPATEGPFLVVAEPARPATVPTRPNKTLNAAAGLLVGLLLGALLAVIFESRDKRVRTKEALTGLLAWPALATIWKADSKEVVINSTSYNVNADGYSILHTNIGFSAIDRPIQTLVVTSARTSEGKSVVAANLAISMAIAGKRTLLVDANLHHPMINEIFNIPSRTQGFTNAIVAFRMPATANPQQGLMPFIQAVNIPNLSVMPSGPLPPVPSEMLASNAMQGILRGLGNSGFEAVVFDTPALVGLSDAAVLASKADATVVVVDITDANSNDLQQTKEVLEQAGAHVIGYVANKQPQSGKSTPYKSVSYPRDANIANQNIEYATPPVAAQVPSAPSKPLNPLAAQVPSAPSKSLNPLATPKVAAPVTPVTWSTPKQSEISAHGIPPKQSEISAHGIPPHSQSLSNGAQFKPSQNSSHGISPQKDR
jgi:capsular exopolysaccharide synthesis family protein